MWNYYLLFDLLTFDVRNLGKSLTNILLIYLLEYIVLIYLFARIQCRRSRCPPAVSEALFCAFVKDRYSGNNLLVKTISLEKLTNNSVVSRFFASIHLMIRQNARICDVVDRFLQNVFWFFLRTFSVSERIPLRSKEVKTFTTMSIKLMPR